MRVYVDRRLSESPNCKSNYTCAVSQQRHCASANVLNLYFAQERYWSAHDL
jgi:hypothetical protein